MVWLWRGPDGVHIVNPLSQQAACGHGEKPVRPSAANADHALRDLRKGVEEAVPSLALPRLATGVGGLEGKDVKPLIEDPPGGFTIPVDVRQTYRQEYRPMTTFPHLYSVTTQGGPEGPLANSSDGGAELTSAPPVQFGGDPGFWSPEHLLTAALSGCLVLTFRAVAVAMGVQWREIRCEAEGTLDRVERRMLFTRFDVRVTLGVARGADHARALAALEKAKAGCLVSNSLGAEIVLHAAVADAD